MGKGVGGMFGKMDSGATNDVDSTGQTVATGTPGAKTVADPNAGLSTGQMAARKAVSRTLSGIGAGISGAASPAAPRGGTGITVAGQPPLIDDGSGSDPYAEYLRRMRMQGGQAGGGGSAPDPFYGG